MSDAVEAVGKLVDAFPNGRSQAPKSYIGALAATLCTYPRQVAAQCADPLRGVARDTRFLPTIADIVAWCEREKAALQQIVDRDDYNAELAKKARELQQQESEHSAARKTRPTLQQMQEKYGPNWGISGAEKEDLIVKAARAETMKKANTLTFERECKAAGVDPALGVSPTLAKLIEEKRP